MDKLRLVARVPVVLAICGAYLNSAELLAEFQPEGRAWAGWVAAAALSVALLVSVEAFIRRPGWLAACGVLGFGLAEVLGQIGHAALVRADFVVLTSLLRYLLAYLAPSVVVIVGVSMPFLISFGFGDVEGGRSGVSPDVAALQASVASLADVVRQQSLAVSARGQGRTRRVPDPARQLELVSSDGRKS